MTQAPAPALSREERYQRFLEAKVCAAPRLGIDAITEDMVNPVCKPHVRRSVPWLARGGRRGLFASFGLQKTTAQLELVRLILQHAGGRGLIVCPLGVRQEFRRDATQVLGWSTPPRFIRSIEEADETGIYLTNYESIRERKLDPSSFTVASLDEAAVLRSFGSKTFGEFLFGPFQDVPYRFVATANPDPNDFVELLGYAQFLGVMDIGQAKTRFFKRDSEHADHLTLHPHKEREFWLWLSTWALFIQRPSDLGFSDEGYELPEIDIRWHEIPTDHSGAGFERSGQGRLYKDTAQGVSAAAREKRESLPARVAKLLEIRAEDPAAHRIIWHDLEAERHAIEAAIPDVRSIYGAQDLDAREETVVAFSDGEFAELAAKPILAGSGCNFQRHCWWEVFLGIGFKFNDFLQAIHRVQRYGQTHRVRLDLIYTEAERPVRRILEEKWRRHVRQSAAMAQIIRDYGLADATAEGLDRSLGVKRVEVEGPGYRLVNNDCVLETWTMADNSVGLVLTSIPFSTQYEYTPSYNDFGHTDDSAHFWAQMDFLTPDLRRVLQPGRDLVVHIKDRVAPGAMSGVGFQTVVPFHAEAITHFMGHGFAYLGMQTIVTDVVRENNQTYRLGWTEQCKDGSRMGAGLPEYLLLFRKLPTDNSDGYADEPVRHEKASYTRARWQVDAHGFWRSNGDRFPTPEDLVGMTWKAIFRAFRDQSRARVYDYEHHVACGEALERADQLPPDFMLLQPQSWHPDVWTDVMRARTLNGFQARKGREKHLCPLQFDIVKRVIEQRSEKGEIVYDPFGGLMTVPYCAIELGRRGVAAELNTRYFVDGADHCAAMAQKLATPTLFDLLEANEEATA